MLRTLSVSLAAGLVLSAGALAQDTGEDILDALALDALRDASGLESMVMIDMNVDPDASASATAAYNLEGDSYATASVAQATPTAGELTLGDVEIVDAANGTNAAVISVNDDEEEGRNQVNALATAFFGDSPGMASADLLQVTAPSFPLSGVYESGAASIGDSGSASITGSFNNNDQAFTITQVNQAAGGFNNQANVASINWTGPAPPAVSVQ